MCSSTPHRIPTKNTFDLIELDLRCSLRGAGFEIKFKYKYGGSGACWYHLNFFSLKYFDALLHFQK